MGQQKITEKELVQKLLESANVLVTMPVEQTDGSSKESLRRVPLAVFLAELYDARIDNPDAETGEDVTHASVGAFLRELSKKVAGAADGVGFSSWYYDTTNFYLHLYNAKGEDVIDPVYIPGGGGGGDSGSVLTVAMQTPTVMSVAESSTEANISMIVKSLDAITQVETGNCTLQVYVGGSLKKTSSIPQGENSVNVRSYLSSGSNAVKLVVTDAYGKTATRNCTISVETLTLEWSLGNTDVASGNLTFTLTPTGNYEKTVYILVDGEEYDSFSVTTTGRKQTKTIEAQAHGGHIVSAYCTMDLNGVLLTSDVLTCAVAWTAEGNTTAVIACDTIPDEISQYSTVNIVHRVVDPQNNPTVVEYLVNGSTYKSEEVDHTEQTWNYRVTAAGEVTLAIKCGDQTYSKKITVTSIGADIEEVTDGLQIKVEPSSMTSLQDWAYGDYGITLSDDFDEVNGGLVNDSAGVRCIRITAGDRLTINYPMFSGDARKNGLAAKVVYMVKDSSKKDTVAISCMSSGIGLEIQANNAYLSGNQTKITLSTCEDMKTELDLNIQPDTEDGLMCMMEQISTFAFQKYATDESFAHTTAQGVTFGSDDADVYLYLFMAWNRDLTDEEMIANYIAHGADTAEILARKDRNDIYSNGAVDPYAAAAKNPDAHVIIINAERMTLGKSDTVYGTIQHMKGSGEADQQFTAETEFVVQGTSSVEHAPTAGPNVNMTFPKGIVLEDGTVLEGYAMHGTANSIPVKEITYKKNIASQDHVVNRAASEWYNRFQPSIRTAREEDPRVRDCMESAMCIVFFHNTGSTAVQVGPDLVQPDGTIFFGLGNLCTNKDSVNAFDYDPIVIEVKNNTEPQVRFKSDDLSGDNFKNNYDFRHLDTTQYSEDEAKALWQVVQTFLYETDYTSPTGNLLAAATTINGVTYTNDTVEYRKARWTAEAPEHFDMDTTYWHDNITLFLLLRDNRAKNMFWSYDPVTKKWRLIFAWDHDTGLCRNNEGYVDIEPGYMDFDTIGTADVFNGADNVLFTNLRECNADALRANYLDRESAGAWDIDAFYSYVKESQDSICEALWLEDAQHNAIRVMQNLNTTAYLARATGKLRLHIKKALMFQKVMVDSYYNATASTSNSAAIRGYTPTEWAGVAPSGLVDVVFYTDMYANVLAGSVAHRQRVKAGETVTLDLSAYLNDTEIYFRDAQWIQSFGDLSGLYLGQFEGSKLKRVRRLLLGSSVEGYYNTNFTTASFDNCKKLEEVNMGGLVNATKAFDFSPNIYLKKLYTMGSGVTGITFAKRGRIQEVYLNAVASLYMNGLYKLETFEMESYAGLTSLTIVDCPTVDSYNIANYATNLTRVRFIDIDWTCGNADTLMRLKDCGGKDDSGYDVDQAVITGNVHIAALSQTKLTTLETEFPDLDIVYDELTQEWILRFWNEGKTKILDEQLIEHGYGGEDPVTRAENPIDKPATEYTDYLVREFAGWSGSFSTIIQDTDVVAMFKERTRYYTAVWYNGLMQVQKKSIPAGGSAVYEGSDLTKTGFIWTGWDKNVKDVLADIDVYATFEAPSLPAEKLDTTQFDYVYSDDKDDNYAYSFGEFIGIITSGLASEYFNQYDKFKMVNVGTVFPDTDVVYSLHSFGHFMLADGSNELAATTWFPIGVLNLTSKWNETNTNVGGYFGCVLDNLIENKIYPSLACHWRAVINPVYVRANAGNQTATINEEVRHMYAPSASELGCYTNDVPFVNEICDEANEKQFSMYTGNAQRIKKTFNNTGTARDYWTRSAWSGSAVAAVLICTDGGSTYAGASNSCCVCPGLSISKINAST